jgi:transposase
MAEDISNLKERLVAGFERGGRRRRFDPRAKRELVQACLQPGVSVAGMALEHGVHANLLRKWVRDCTREAGIGKATNRLAENASSAFVPVVQIDAAQPAAYAARRERALAPTPSSPRSALASRLVAELPNGVVLKLDCSEHDTTLMSMMIETLVRSHVPARC